MDINAIKKKLTQLQTTTTKQNNLWKPQPGKQQIRVVPYKHNKDNPFIELYFHYDLGGRTYLSPKSFGRPDPIEEFADKLKSSGNKDDWKLGRKLEAKMRTFVPIVERGKETDGLKFWGFGKTVYQELLGFIADPDYGDISDPTNGRDVVVHFRTAEETGKSFPSTSIMVKPNVTPMTEDKKQMTSWFENQQNLSEVYKEMSYDELTEVLEAWLNPTEDGEGTSTSQTQSSVNTSTTETTNVGSTTEATKTTTEKPATATAESVGDAFDELFKD